MFAIIAIYERVFAVEAGVAWAAVAVGRVRPQFPRGRADADGRERVAVERHWRLADQSQRYPHAPAPPGGLSVSLGCNPAGAVGLDANTPFPTTVTVPAGQSGCSYAALTSTANAPTPITITATLGTQSQTTTLTLLPAHLRVTKVLPASTLRLQWDQTNYSFFQLLRDGSLLATLPGSTLTYDDAIAGGFAPNHTYVYTLLGQSNGSYAQIDMEMVIPGSVTTAGSNQAVDSRLDLRYSDNHLLDHVFGATTYRGGLFVGYSSDPVESRTQFRPLRPVYGWTADELLLARRQHQRVLYGHGGAIGRQRECGLSGDCGRGLGLQQAGLEPDRPDDHAFSAKFHAGRGHEWGCHQL